MEQIEVAASRTPETLASFFGLTNEALTVPPTALRP